MQKYIAVLFTLLFYSCGEKNSANPSNETRYHSDDETFISQLIEANGIERDTLINRIIVETIIVAGDKYDRIIKMDISGLELDILPSSIGDLTKH